MHSVVFSLGKKSYAVNALAVQEILEHPTTTSIPESPAHILGTTDYHGRAILVVHLGKLLGVQSLDNGPRAIVLEDTDLCAAFVVDEVTDILEIPDHSIDPLPAGVGTTQSISGAVAHVGENVVVIVDPIAILKKAETRGPVYGAGQVFTTLLRS